MATTQQNGEGEQSPSAENIMILESIDGLTAQLKENLLKAEEARQKRAETPEESPNAVLWKQREEIAELKQANASAKGRIDAMKTHYHRLAKYTESQVNKLQEQLKGYEEAKNTADKDMQKRIGEFEKRCEGHKAVEDELERTKKELESEKKECAFLQRKVEDFETRTKQLENWEKIQEDLARALSARDEYKRRCQELEAAKSTGGKKLGALYAEFWNNGEKGSKTVKGHCAVLPGTDHIPERQKTLPHCPPDPGTLQKLLQHRALRHLKDYCTTKYRDIESHCSIELLNISRTVVQPDVRILRKLLHHEYS